MRTHVTSTSSYIVLMVEIHCNTWVTIQYSSTHYKTTLYTKLETTKSKHYNKTKNSKS